MNKEEIEQINDAIAKEFTLHLLPDDVKQRVQAMLHNIAQAGYELGLEAATHHNWSNDR